MKLHTYAPSDGLLMVVEDEIVGCHPMHPKYPLLRGDCLTKHEDGTFTKHTGLGMMGFTLTPEQESALVPTAGEIRMGAALGDIGSGVPIPRESGQDGER